MRRQAALFFQTRQRRGEWNALLLVMFALLAVAPSVLSAAPLRDVASHPQAVWQWLQSPEGAPTRDLLALSLDLEHFPNLPPAEWAAILSKCEIARAECGIAVPSHPASHPACLHLAEPVPAFTHSSFVTRRSSLLHAMSPHEAAFRSGTRANAWLE